MKVVLISTNLKKKRFCINSKMTAIGHLEFLSYDIIHLESDVIPIFPQYLIERVNVLLCSSLQQY